MEAISSTRLAATTNSAEVRRAARALTEFAAGYFRTWRGDA
jgi:hypothetical protein